MKSKPKTTKKKPPKVADEPHRRPTKLDPAQVRLLTIQQVRNIIIKCELCADPTDALVAKARFAINAALFWLKPRFQRDVTTDLEDVRVLLKNLKTKFTPANIQLLSAVSAVAKGDHPRKGSMTDTAAMANVEEFKNLAEKILGWLSDRRACNVVLGSLKPDLDLQTVAGHLLPDAFQMTFFKKFGSGDRGPGVSFVVAVMREAGLLHHDDTTTASYVHKARQRMSKPSALPSKVRLR